MQNPALTEKLAEVFRNTFIELADTETPKILAVSRDNFAGWDSVNQLYLVQTLEESFQIRIPDSLASSINSFEKAADTIRKLNPVFT